MGEKGGKLTGEASATAEELVDALQELGGVASKKMFGGCGVFCDDVMFALVDSAGTPFFRASDDQVEALEASGAVGHGRMPYWSITDSERTSEERLLGRAREALETAREAKKK